MRQRAGGRSRRRSRVTAGVLTVAAVLFAFLLASVVGARVAVAGSRAPLPVPPRKITRHWVPVSFPSRIDHLRLSGWLLRSPRPTGRSLILVHGWQGNREDADFVPVARAMLSRGYDVLMFDLRGSGASQGATETLGHDEPRDLLGAYDFMRQRGYSPSRMVILGNSMGAASTIEAAPQLRQVAALVSDSSFARLGPSMETALHHFTGLPGFLALPAMAFASAFDVRPTLSPVSVVRSLPGRAILFIHARGDGLIPIANARALAAASPNPATRLLVLGGSHHLDTYTHAPRAYIQALTLFIDRQIKQRGSAATLGSPRGAPG